MYKKKSSEIEQIPQTQEKSLPEQQQTITISKSEYERLKQEAQKYKLQNYALKLEIERFMKTKGSRKMNYYYGRGLKKITNEQNNIGEENPKQEKNQQIEEEQQRQDLMVSWHPNLKVTPNQIKNQSEKNKFKKQMELWSKNIGSGLSKKISIKSSNLYEEPFLHQTTFNVSSQKNIPSMSKRLKTCSNKQQIDYINQRPARKSQETPLMPPLLSRITKEEKNKYEQQRIEQEENYPQKDTSLQNSQLGQSFGYVLDLKKQQGDSEIESKQISIPTEFIESQEYNFNSMCEIVDPPLENLEKNIPKQKSQGQIKVEEHRTHNNIQSNKQLRLNKQPLIEAICLFGPSRKNLSKALSTPATANSRKFSIPQSLLFYNNSIAANTSPKQFEVYGEYFYTEEGQVVCRKIKQQEHNTQAHHVIFRKNAKKEDCSLFLFRGDELWEENYGKFEQKKKSQSENDPTKEKKNQEEVIQWKLLTRINAGKLLCIFVLQFSDYEIIHQSKDSLISQQKNKSFQALAGSSKPNKTIQVLEQSKEQGKKSDRAVINEESPKNKVLIKSKYSLCIFTYFPLVNPMQTLLTSIIDEIKIRRVQKYAQNNSDISRVSVDFFVEQLNDICFQINKSLIKIPTINIYRPNSAQYRHLVTFRSNKVIQFNFCKDTLYQTMFAGWVYEILKIFEKDQLYQIFNYILFQQSVCFVSQNLSLLTHVIFFFVSVLLHPFSYPYPCISLVSDFQFLDSPFIVTTGINKSTKWLDQNYNSLNGKKIFIDLNTEQPKIRLKNKPKFPKSEKLKKIFNNFYKKLAGNQQLPQILFKKKENVIRPVTRDQNFNSYNFIFGLRTYYQQQILKYLPNPEIITFIKNTVKEENQTSKMFNLLKEIEKYVRESRKQIKDKDPFIEGILQQQVFYFYVSARYQLN